MFRRIMALTSLGIVALVVLLAGQANACTWGAEDYHFPSCSIPVPDDSETVSVVTVRDFPSGGSFSSATVHVGEPTKATALATIDIAHSERKHYLILQSDRQIIWNIEGDTDDVSRVVVLGATRLGPWAAGVIGIPEDRITFTSPDLKVLEQVRRTSCTRIRFSCIASQWFGRPPSDWGNFHPSPEQERLRVDAFVKQYRSSRRQQSEWPVTFRNVERTTVPVVVDPEQVVAPRGAAPYDQQTGQVGLDELVKSGALLAAGSPAHEAAVRRYAELFSARYRTRFNPEYLFLPRVDYVVTRPVKLPADAGSRTFLLGTGVPLPEMNGNDVYQTCFLAMDRASEPIGRRDLKSLFCREDSLGIREPGASVFLAAQRADGLKLGDNCRQASLLPGTKVVVLNVIETGRKRSRVHPLREIEVEVSGGGPVVLYVQTSGGPAQWTLQGEQIAQVFMSRPPEHTKSRMTLNGTPLTFTRLGIDGDNCPFFAPYQLELRGPTYLHLDQMIKTLLGQPIDRLIEKRAEGAEPIRITID